MKAFLFIRNNSAIQYLAMLCIGVTLLIIRDADPLFNPVMYTEDGQWTGMGITYGWLHTFYYAKDGYLVWGNLILLWLSNIGSMTFCQNGLICLPESLAIMSYIFYASTAILSFAATKDLLRVELRVLLFLLCLFMPLGNSANEILGRASNIGYYFVYLTFLLLLIRESLTLGGRRHILDLLLLIGLATNPVCIPLLAIYMIKSWWKPVLLERRFEILKDNIFLILGSVFVFILVVIKQVTMQKSGVTGELNTASLVEVALARAILYPFTFSFYQELNDFFSIILFCIWLSVVGVALYFAPSHLRKVILYALGVLFIYLLFTLCMRQSLTQQLGGYKVTFPDRYFMGLNILSVFIICLCLNAILNTSYKYFGLAGIIFIAHIYVGNFHDIEEYSKPRFLIPTEQTFTQELCLNGNAKWLDGGPSVHIPIHSLWFMELPQNYLKNTVQKINCDDVFLSFFLTDSNWIKGVARSGAGFLVFNSPMTQGLFSVGRVIKFRNGESRVVTSQIQSGKYLNVYLNGVPLDVDAVGLPSTYEVIK